MIKKIDKTTVDLNKRFDVVICGGGLVGLSLGCALAGVGMDVVVIERDEFIVQDKAEYDGRASAISYGSSQIFKSMGLWVHLEQDASPIKDIRVVDGHVMRGIAPLFLHYDHKDLGTDSGIGLVNEPFGYIIENRAIRMALHHLAANLPNLLQLAGVNVKNLMRDQNLATAVLADGRQIKASLAVAADGKFSKIRNAAGIKCTSWDYDQTAIVCTLEHECDHLGTAVELFLPGGPFAMLPMTNKRSNIVWSECSDLAANYMKLDDQAYLAELSLRFGQWLGDIKLIGPRFAYPLSFSLAQNYVDERLALIGDAAHSIHPIAGQGFNLGIRDMAAMAEALVDAKRLGLDIGAGNVLDNYQKRRRFDNTILATVCDGLLKLFSNDVESVRLARDIGLATVNQMPPLKKLLMRHAMGVVGDLPRMVNGEAL